jgi:hypothetical protein
LENRQNISSKRDIELKLIGTARLKSNTDCAFAEHPTNRSNSVGIRRKDAKKLRRKAIAETGQLISRIDDAGII